MSRTYLAKHVPEVRGSWTAELRAGGAVQDEIIDEIVPIVVRLEQAGLTSCDPGWPPRVAEGLALSRRARRGIRRIERTGESGGMIAIVKREQQFDYGQSSTWYLIECASCARSPGSDDQQPFDDHGRALVWAVGHARRRDDHERFQVTIERRPKRGTSQLEMAEKLGQYEISIRHLLTESK
jgi:hypothetical protein